jgi:hypothetical protein
MDSTITAISESGENGIAQKSLSLSAALRASRFLSLAVNEDLTISTENLRKNSLTSLADILLGGSFGRTSLVFFRLPVEERSGTSLPDLQNAGMGWGGEFLMLNISESPSVAVESSLLDVLEAPLVPEKYYLTPQECRYILDQREVRKRTIKEPMRSILKRGACREL